MSQRPVVNPKSTFTRRSYNVPKEGSTLEPENTDMDEEYARQLQLELYNEQEQMDIELARRIQEEENSQHRLDENNNNGNATPSAEQELYEPSQATPASSHNSENAGATVGRDVSGLVERRFLSRSPDNARRLQNEISPDNSRRLHNDRSSGRAGILHNDRSPVRALQDRSCFWHRRAVENSNRPDTPNIHQDSIPFRTNPAVFRNQPRTRRGVVNTDHDGQENSENTAQANYRPVALRRSGLRPRGLSNVPDGELARQLGLDSFFNVLRHPLLQMFMGRDPGFVIPDNVDPSDYAVLLDLAERNGDVQRRGMTEEEIKIIPTTAYTRRINKDDSCSICLSKFANYEQIHALSCKHEYHQHCLIEWLKINAVCPMCRLDLKTTGS